MTVFAPCSCSQRSVCERGGDARFVADLAVFERHVEVFAYDDALAAHVDIIERLELHSVN